ncbi:MAG TPA: hypothetical protein P5050_06040 [Bacteroidia bacterium]|nr:hypothetical protein [Bacteroidia bacterium]HRS58766.1 hypothetical protein [Bacteroidia bacterium]
MLKIFFRTISILLHPVWYVFYLTIYLYFNTPLFYHYRGVRSFYLLCSVVLINTVLLPVIFTFLTQKDLYLESKEKRPFIYVVTAFFYLLFLFLSGKFALPSLLIFYLRFSILSLIFLLLLNFRMKASLHLAGSGSILAILLFLASQNPQIHGISLIIWIVLSGISASGRLYLQQHTLKEIIWGFLAGFFPLLTLFFLI